MKRKLVIGLLAYWIIGFFFLSSTQKISAQSYSLSISPSLMELVIKPGKSISQSFKIQNMGDETTVTPHLFPLLVDKETGDIRFSYKQSLSNETQEWFSLLNTDLALDKPFFLRTNEQKELVLKIAIPESEQNGDHYVLFAVKAKSPPTSALTAANIETIIGSNLLISISNLGTLNKTGEINQMNFPIFMDSFDRLEGSIKVQNSGTAFFKPTGKVIVQGPFFKTELPTLEQNILVGTKRVVQTDPSTAKTISLKGFFLGPYSVTTEIQPDGTKIKLKKSMRILAFPWKGTLVLLVIIGSLYLYKRRKT